jgi:hypothetical protein
VKNQMDLSFEHDDFRGRDLTIRTAGLFKSARLFVDHVEVKGKRSKFSVSDNKGRTREIKLKLNGLDPAPKVEIDGITISLTRSLTWYEYLWIGLPIVLVFTGGALGAIFGLFATYASSRIFRSNRKPGAKYVLTGAVSLGAVAAFFISAGTIQLFISAKGNIASKESLKDIARKTNVDLPKMVDEQTELSKLDALEGVLVYYYRLPKVQPGQITEKYFQEQICPIVTKNACTNEELRKKFLNKGVVLRYIYIDSQGGEIAQFDVIGKNCP